MSILKVPKTLLRFISPEYRAFYKLGWVDNSLRPTAQGVSKFSEFLFAKYEKDFGEFAIDTLEEELAKLENREVKSKRKAKKASTEEVSTTA